MQAFMWRLLLFSALAVITYGSCPSGFELVVNGECRGSYINVTLGPENVTEVTTAKCAEIQGLPVIIHNDEEQNYWTRRAGSKWNTPPILALGLSCNSTTSKWEWADGSALDYKPALHDTRLNSPCKCGFRFFLTSNGNWQSWDGVGNSNTVDVSCTTQLHSTIGDDECSTFADDTEDGVCYQVGESAENWQDAQMVCKKLGANLASIHNVQENSFLRRLAVSKGDLNGILLGATTSGKDETFGWIDGSAWDYDNFAPGFPKKGFGDCVVMDTSTSAGQWKNIDYTEEYPVACIRDQRVPVEPVCSSDVWEEGSIITSPGFPYNASTPCDYYLMVDEGKRVEVEIILLEANSCCDNFVLYDGYVGGVVLANLTGAVYNATFTTTSAHKMLVSWQPNGGVGVLGLAMTFRGV